MAARDSPFPRFQRRREPDHGPGWLAHDLGGYEAIGRLHLRLRPGPEAASEGRHALDRLEGCLDPAQLSELRLLVTELLTNSVRHGSDDRGRIELDVEIYANALRAVVTDSGPGFEPDPEPTPHLDRPGGWGLCLVNRLADRWGVERDDGTAVWFEIDEPRFAHAA
jgi:anti-sigma regulatory factor (Ser/Thr protein kinase)